MIFECITLLKLTTGLVWEIDKMNFEWLQKVNNSYNFSNNKIFDIKLR
jgi:hypothetical protein